MRTECPAKVNLRLRVFGVDDSGYHGVETLLARTDLTDTLELERTEAGIEVMVHGDAADGVPEGPDNLCHRAAKAFLDTAFRGRGPTPGVRFRLEKRIPAGTGLGGGSADAAGALRLLAAEWPGVEDRELFAIAGRLGSDIPFGLLDVPLALGWERGRRLLPLRPPRARPGLIACPPIRVATPDAYGWLDASREDTDPGGGAVLPGPARLVEWSTISRIVANDFEAPVVRRHPELGEALARLGDHAAIASLTGSGPALFAVFEDAHVRAAGRDLLSAAGFGAGGGWRLIDVMLPV